MPSKREPTSVPGIQKHTTAAGVVTYQGRFSYPRDQSTGKRPAIPVKEFTLDAARRAKQRALNQINEYPENVPTKMTVGRFVQDVWLPHREDMVRRRDLERSTLDRNKRDLLTRILPRIGDIEIQKLTTRHINRMITDLKLAGRREGRPEAVQSSRQHDPRVAEAVKDLRTQGLTFPRIAELIALSVPGEENITRYQVSSIWWRMNQPRKPVEGRRALPGVSPATAKAALVLITQILKHAIVEDIVSRNVAASAEQVKLPKSRQLSNQWSREQTSRFMEWLFETGERDYFLFQFIANSGDRRGANLGVRWRDIDWDGNDTYMLWTVTEADKQAPRWVKPYDKTGEQSIIALDEATRSVLLLWMERQRAERALFGDNVHVCDDIPGFTKGNTYDPLAPDGCEPTCDLPGYHERDLVFCAPDGDFYRPATVYKIFKRRQAQYNRAHLEAPLPDINLHALRGGWSSTARRLGIDQATRMAQLNHKSARVHAGYTRIGRPNEHEREAAARVASSFTPASVLRQAAPDDGAE